MKRRDVLTAIGIVVGFLMMIWAMAMVTITEYNIGQLKLFWDISSIIITIGGSFCAMLVNYPIHQFRKLTKIIIQAFKRKREIRNRHNKINLLIYLEKQDVKDFFL